MGSILYYAQAINMTVLMALSTIAEEQTKATENNDAEMHTIIRLPLVQFGGKSEIPCIGYGNKYTFRRFLPN